VGRVLGSFKLRGPVGFFHSSPSSPIKGLQPSITGRHPARLPRPLLHPIPMLDLQYPANVQSIAPAALLRSPRTRHHSINPDRHNRNRRQHSVSQHQPKRYRHCAQPRSPIGLDCPIFNSLNLIDDLGEPFALQSGSNCFHVLRSFNRAAPSRPAPRRPCSFNAGADIAKVYCTT